MPNFFRGTPPAWKQTRAQTPPHHPRPENLFNEWKVRTLAERFPLQTSDAEDDKLIHSIRHKLDSWDSFQERERCFLLAPGNQIKEATYHKSVIRNIPWSPPYASLVHISGDSVLTELPNAWRLFRDRTTQTLSHPTCRDTTGNGSQRLRHEPGFKGIETVAEQATYIPIPGHTKSTDQVIQLQGCLRERPQREFADQTWWNSIPTQIAQNRCRHEVTSPIVLIVGSQRRFPLATRRIGGNPRV